MVIHEGRIGQKMFGFQGISGLGLGIAEMRIRVCLGAPRPTLTVRIVALTCRCVYCCAAARRLPISRPMWPWMEGPFVGSIWNVLVAGTMPTMAPVMSRVSPRTLVGLSRLAAFPMSASVSNRTVLPWYSTVNWASLLRMSSSKSARLC